MTKLVLPLLFLSSFAWANDCQNNRTVKSTDLLRRLASVESTQPLTSTSTPTSADRSGCCSHHQGVCGCSNGRAVCCDGSYSPSCGCN